MTVASRICLDLLGSARKRRETYVGEWIPEPLPDRSRWSSQQSADSAVDPADRITLDESVNMAFLVVLESMTPAERVAFILHDVFRYPFAEIAQIVGRTPEACRQLASSARRRIGSTHLHPTSSGRNTTIVSAFKRAWEDGDLMALLDLLDPDATAVADGGGLVSAEPRPIEGAEAIARFIIGLAGQPDVTLRESRVNGQPGLLIQVGGELAAVVAVDLADDVITHLWAVRNPEKLRAWRSGSTTPGGT